MVKVGDKVKITKIKINVEEWEEVGIYIGEIYEVVYSNEKGFRFKSDKTSSWFCYHIDDDDFEYEVIKEFKIVSNGVGNKPTKHKEICGKLNEIYASKNHDYGDSFGETYKKLGIISAVTRITDKVNRLQSLCTKEQKVKDESIEDTLMDLANYSIMTLIELKGENSNEYRNQ